MRRGNFHFPLDKGVAGSYLVLKNPRCLLTPTKSHVGPDPQRGAETLARLRLAESKPLAGLGVWPSSTKQYPDSPVAQWEAGSKGPSREH